MPTPTVPAPARAFAQALLVALLALNTAFYAAAGTPAEAIDSIAWLTLLVLLLWESKGQRTTEALAGVRLVRLAAALAVTAAAAGYVQAAAWLEAGNAALWIAVVALLEIEVRRPGNAQLTLHRIAASALYAALFVMVLVWAAQEAWIAAYDALLWLAAFVTIELDMRPALLTPRRTPRETPQ